MEIIVKINKIKYLIESWNLNYQEFNIEGVSHLYAIWFIGLYIVNNGHESEDQIEDKLIEFYTDLRTKKKIPEANIYQQSMQSASRSKSARRKRVNALLSYLNYEEIK